MKSILLISFAIFVSVASPAMAENCYFKGVTDKVDGKIFYTLDHRLYKFVKLKAGEKRFCSEDEAESAGYKPAPEHFSSSTARLIECVEDGDAGCQNYVIGQYRSLEIYDKACANTQSVDTILNGFTSKAKTDQKNLDVAKFYGTTSALMKAFPCR